MRAADSGLLELLDLLHRASDEVGAWQGFLDTLRVALEGDVAVLFTGQPHESSIGLLVGSLLGVTSVPLGDFLRPSVRHPDGTALPLGSVLELPADHPAFVDTTLYREVLAPAGLLPGPGLVVVTERDDRQVRSAVLVLPTSPHWKPRAADRVLLARLAPHMVIARRMQRRLARRGRDARALVAAFDHLVLGVVLLDERRRVSYANRSAAELFGFESGFTDDAVLVAEALDARTSALLQLHQIRCDGTRSRLTDQHPHDGRQVQVLAAPLRWGSRAGIERSRFVHALFLVDPGQRASDPLRLLHELYGLTRGQTHLSLLLVGGCSLDEAAELLEISSSTARSVLKQVFEKTETHRQTDLVRLLLSVFGRVRADAGREPE